MAFDIRTMWVGLVEGKPVLLDKAEDGSRAAHIVIENGQITHVYLLEPLDLSPIFRP
jgi:hypothetical protein